MFELSTTFETQQNYSGPDEDLTPLIYQGH